MEQDNLKWREINFDSYEDKPGTEAATREKVNYVDANLWEKVETIGKKVSLLKDIKALYQYMKDPYVSWHRKAIVAAALIYFITPIDAIPDISPLIGYLDDLGVITALLKYLGHELMSYYN